MSKIVNWKTKETIIEDENLTIKELAEKAIKDNICLAYAHLWNANLVAADLRGADLRNAILWNANLVAADLRGAVNLRDATLRGADLTGIKINEDQKDDLLKAMGIRIK